MAELLSFLPKKEQSPALPDGTRVFVEMLEEVDLEGNFRDVDEHEAEHAVVAIRNGTGVIEASTNPSGNVLGFVRMTRADPVAAATSRDRRGNAGDRMLVEGTGHDFHSAGDAANSVKARNRKVIRAVAVALCKHRHLSGKQIEKIINTVDKGELVRARIVYPDGREETVTKRAKPGEKLTLHVNPKAKTIERKPGAQPLLRLVPPIENAESGDIKTEDDFTPAAG